MDIEYEKNRNNEVLAECIKKEVLRMKHTTLSKWMGVRNKDDYYKIAAIINQDPKFLAKKRDNEYEWDIIISTIKKDVTGIKLSKIQILLALLAIAIAILIPILMHYKIFPFH